MDHENDSDSFEIVDANDIAAYIAEESKPDLARITGWLQPTAYEAASSEYARHLSSQAPGTSDWIRETSQFEQWHLSDSHGALWIKAVPGAGKSVLAAAMVESLGKNEGVPVVFFFFRKIIEKNRSARGALRDWLAQLLPWCTRLQTRLWEAVEEGVGLDSVPTADLWDWARSALSELERVYCVVDALDEMDLDEDFLASLNELGLLRPAHVKVLMTSRPKQYLQSALRNPQVVHVSLEEELVKRDIAMFVRQRAQRLVQHGANLKMQKLIQDTVCERSSGLFLYARLMLDQIEETMKTGAQREAELQNMIARLPVGLEEMYNRVLGEHAAKQHIKQKIQVFVLQLVTHAARPLRLIEIAAALKRHVPAKSQSERKTMVRNACGPLLEVMEDEVVQVLHHSFTEFLHDESREQTDHTVTQQFPVVNSLRAHHQIASTCLESLTSDTEKDMTREAIKLIKPNDLFGQVPFLEYSAAYWFYHAIRYDIDDEAFFQTLDRFCAVDSIHFAVWKAIASSARATVPLQESAFPLDGAGGDWASENSSTTQLHLAAAFGLSFWGRYLIRNGADVNAMDFSRGFPIHLAANEGKAAIVEMLLRAGAEPDKADRYGLKPVHSVAMRGRVEVIKLLLSAGVSPVTPLIRNTDKIRPGAPKRHPLQLAAQRGHADIVHAMIPFTTTKQLEEALCTSVSSRRSQVARVILDHSSVSPNCIREAVYTGRQYANPQPVLMLAAKALDLECVKMLLERGASVSKTCERPTTSENARERMKNPHPQTALHRLAEAATQPESKDMARSILKALLNAGADLEAKDGLGNTPLLVASRNGHAMDIFIEAGADINALNDAGESLLHIACSMSNDNEVIERLLKHNPNPTQARHVDGATAIHCYINSHCHDRSFNPKTFERLTANGTHINVQDSEGNTPLHLVAFRNDSETALRTILRLGADVNLLNHSNRTCLHAIKSRHFFIPQTASSIKILVEAGLNIETRNRDGLTVLLNAVSQLPAMVETIIQLPQKPNCSSTALDGKSVLHLACQHVAHNFPPDVFSLLLDSGADPLLVDGKGNTLLHEIGAVFEGFTTDVELVNLIIDSGVPIDAVNDAGQSAAHMMKHVDEKTAANTNSVRTREVFSTLLLKALPKLDINVMDDKGYTPLHYAATSTALNAQSLIRAGANIRVRGKDGRTPLHCAAIAGNADLILMILNHLSDPELEEELVSADVHGYTPLHCACESSQPECVSILKEAKANGPDDRGETNILLTMYNEKLAQIATTASLASSKPDAIRSGLDTTTPLQYRRNAVFRILTGAGMPPIDTSTTPQTYGLPEIFEPLLDIHRANASPPVLQSVDALVEMLDDSETARLLAHGFDFAHAPLHAKGTTPVSRMVARGMVDCVGMILDKAKLFDDSTFLRHVRERLLHAGKGFNFDEIQPMIHVACDRQVYNMKMIKLLVEKGALDVNAHRLVPGQKPQTQRSGNCALHVLAEGHYWWQLEAIEYLVSQGADLESLDEDGRTPLHIASTQTFIGYHERLNHFKPDCSNLLLRLGANPNHIDNHGKVPLNKAGSDLELVKNLLESGASVNIGKKSPIITAMELGSVELLRLYLEHGAHPNIPDTSTGNPSMAGFRFDHFIRFPLFSAVYPHKYQPRPIKDTQAMTNLLIDYGTKIDEPISEDKMLVHFLFENVSSTRLRPIFERPGLLDVNLKDQKGRTVFMASLASRVVVDPLDSDHSRGKRPWANPGLVDSKEEAKRMYVPAHQLLLDSPLHGPVIDFLARDATGQTVLTYYVDRVTRHNTPETRLLPYLLSIPGLLDLVHIFDARGFSPLHNSIRFHFPDLAVQLLDEYGANILQRGPEGDTCLHYIAKTMAPGLIPLIGRYIAASENQEDAPASAIDVRNDTGQTPLLAHLTMPCAFCYDPDYPPPPPTDPPTPTPEWELPENRFNCLKTWISYGADIFAVDEKGNGVLHYIARFRCKGLFEWLMAKGCDPLRENVEGRSALDVAATTEVGSGSQGILRLFRRQKGSDR